MKVKYSRNPDDWKIQHTCCDRIAIYTDLLTYKNAVLRFEKTGILKCTKHRSVGTRRSDITKVNMSHAAKNRKIDPVVWKLRSEKLSRSHRIRYADMSIEERVDLTKKIVWGQWNKPRDKIDEWHRRKSEARKFEMVANGVCDTFKPSYNKSTIPYIIEVLNKQYNTNFIHAESKSGEYKIYDMDSRRFYYADAYCPKRNIWIEFDEDFHYRNGCLKESDIYRQNRIEEILSCTVVRIKLSDIQLITY